MKKNLDVFYYRVKILRETKDGGQVTATREGTLMAPWPLTALDEIVKMAVEVWKRPLQKIELFKTDEHGELVATTTLGDRIDSVLATHKVLRPNSGLADMASRREKRKDAKPTIKPKLPQQTTTTTPRELTEWNWTAECGVRYVPTFYKVQQLEEQVC